MLTRIDTPPKADISTHTSETRSPEGKKEDDVFHRQRRSKMKWGPQAKLIDEALLKYYFVNISLLPRYIFIQHIKSSQNT